MADPSPLTKLMSLISKAQQHDADHAKAAADHSQRHMEARDAERANRALARRAGSN